MRRAFFMPRSQLSTVEVAAGLIFRHGKLLITQRLKGSHLGGLWEFPGGKMEPGESPEQCLCRELTEELAIKVDVGLLLAEMSHVYPEKEVRLKFFRCTMLGGEPEAIGCQAFEWVTAERLGEFEFPPADGELLDRLRAGEWWETK